MSIQATRLVWKHSKQFSTGKLLMLAVADHTNKDGVAWPSINRLAGLIGVTPRSIKRLIQYAEEAGELKVNRGAGRGHTNEYFIMLKGDTGDTIKDKEKVTPVAEKVTNSATERSEKVTPMSPEPLYKENLIEPLMILAEYFYSKTGLYAPHESSYEWTDLWSKPLEALFKHCAEDQKATKQLIEDAIGKTRELGYRIVTPKSIYKVALNLTAKDRVQVSVAVGSR